MGLALVISVGTVSSEVGTLSLDVLVALNFTDVFTAASCEPMSLDIITCALHVSTNVIRTIAEDRLKLFLKNKILNVAVHSLIKTN
ncbi:MAG: hypothetical protein A2W06_02865 [Alphaproteobacteria bacterium RBG_16_42_14]|nr:MAG: hypothetical protein A2W06_02865 [Alphaproteobacteria bacterium RBG_16_42_14]OFW92730.1 MAG: hypothetical protein A3C41_07205 [Alphaproteobacteria bacterium RIFCSPHIGHO2_02_FULL_42_30]